MSISHALTACEELIDKMQPSSSSEYNHDSTDDVEP